MQQVYRAPSPATRKRKAQELLAKHALAWEAQLEQASIVRRDKHSVLKLSTVYREKVRLDAINEARRRQRINLSWESSLRTLQTAQAVPIGNRFSGLQCMVSNDPYAINIQNIINMPPYKDPIEGLPEDLRTPIVEYKLRAAQRAVHREAPVACDLPDALINENLDHFHAFSTPGTESPKIADKDISEDTSNLNSARTNNTGKLSSFTARGQRLPAGTAAQKADKLAQYIAEKNSHIVNTYMPELRWDVTTVNAACIVEPIAFASKELHPSLEVTNLTVVTYNSRDKAGCNVASVTIRNTGDSVVSLQLVPKGTMDVSGLQTGQPDGANVKFLPRSDFHDRTHSPESTRSLMSLNSSTPVQRIRQNLGAAPSSTVNRILDLVSQEPRRYQSTTSAVSYNSLGATVNLVGAAGARVQHKQQNQAQNSAAGNLDDVISTHGDASGTDSAQMSTEAKKLVQKSFTPIELRVLVNKFLKDNKGAETSLIVSVPSSTWNINPGCNTTISFILPLSEAGVATPGIILREYYVVTKPAVEVNLLSLEDILHADRLIETASDSSSTRITIRCYGIASEFLQVSNSIRSLSKRGTKMMSELYVKQMCSELVSELIFLSMEITRVNVLEETGKHKHRSVAKYNISTKAMNIYEKGVVNATWAGPAAEIKALLSDLIVECEGLDLTVQSVMYGYTDGYFSDECATGQAIKQRRIFALYNFSKTADPEGPTQPYCQQALISAFGYVAKSQMCQSTSGSLQRITSGDSGLNNISHTLKASSLPPMEIPSTARFAMMKVDMRFKAAADALACKIGRFTHEVLPSKQLIFYRNSPHHLKLSTYSNSALKVLVMPAVSRSQEEASPSMVSNKLSKPPQQQQQEASTVPTNSPLAIFKSPVGLPTQALQLDAYRHSSLELITEHIVVDGSSDDITRITLPSLEAIEYSVFKRAASNHTKLLALTAPIFPTMLSKFLYEKLGNYCQLLLEKQVVKVMNRGKNVPHHRLILMSDGLLNVSSRPSWADNISTLISMAAATSTPRPVNTIFGDHMASFTKQERESLVYLVKLRYLLHFKVYAKVGSFVPYLWEAINTRFYARRRSLHSDSCSGDDIGSFKPSTTLFALKVFYDLVKVTHKTIAEEEAQRLEAEKSKKPTGAQKPVAPIEDTSVKPKSLQSFRDLFAQHLFYVNPNTNEPYDGPLQQVDADGTATQDSSQIMIPKVAEEPGIPQDEIDTSLKAVVEDLAELMLRETLYLETMLGRAYLPLVYKDQDINALDPDDVTVGTAFPNEQLEWTKHVEKQGTPFSPVALTDEYRNILYAHYDTTLFNRNTSTPTPYQSVHTMSNSGKFTMVRKQGSEQPDLLAERASSIYLLDTLSDPHSIIEHLNVRPLVQPIAESQTTSTKDKKPAGQNSTFIEPQTVKVQFNTAAKTLEFELNRALCNEGLGSMLKAAYSKAEPISPAQETVKKGVKGKEEPQVPMTPLTLPSTFLGVYFADTDPSTLASRLFSRAFLETHAKYLSDTDKPELGATAVDEGTGEQPPELADALECLRKLALQPLRPMRLNHALLDAVFATTQLSAFPKTATIDSIIHYLSMTSFKYCRQIFEKQYALVNNARAKLLKYVANICTSLFAQSLGLTLPLQKPTTAPGGQAAASKNRGADAATLALIQLVEQFKESLIQYLSQYFASEVVFLDPNMLLHLGRLVIESKQSSIDVSGLTAVFSELTNYTSLAPYDNEHRRSALAALQKKEKPKSRGMDNKTGENRDEESFDNDILQHSTKPSAIETELAPSQPAKHVLFKRKINTKLTLSIADINAETRSYMGLTSQLEEAYLEILTLEQIAEYKLSKEYYNRLGTNVTNPERFIKRRVSYEPEFDEALDIESLVYELKLASFQREFDTFIDALFTHYTDDLIEEHRDALALYDDELDEYELTYQKLTGVANGELTMEEAGIDANSLMLPSELPVPTKPDVALYPTVRRADLQNDADNSTISRYVGFTYSSAYEKASLEYLVEGLILTLFELLNVTKRMYRSQAPEEYDAQNYDTLFDTAVWNIVHECGYSEDDIQKIKAKYATMDDVDVPLDEQDLRNTASHTNLSEMDDEEPSSVYLKPMGASSENLRIVRDKDKDKDKDTGAKSRENGDAPAEAQDASDAKPASGSAAQKQQDENADDVEVSACRNDTKMYIAPDVQPSSFNVPRQVFEKLCALFNIKPKTLNDSTAVKDAATHPVEDKYCSSNSTVDLSLISFVGDIRVRSLSSFDTIYRYLQMHKRAIETHEKPSKVGKMPVYLSLLTPSGPFGTIFADQITQPSATKCPYVVDITEENALLLGRNLNIPMPKPEKESKSKAGAAKGDAAQKEQKPQSRGQIAPKEGQTILDTVAESLTKSTKLQNGDEENKEADDADDMSDNPFGDPEPGYVVPMNKPVELGTAARRDVWGLLFDRFLDRAFAWVDACEKVPELVVKVVNYAARDFTDFTDLTN